MLSKRKKIILPLIIYFIFLLFLVSHRELSQNDEVGRSMDSIFYMILFSEIVQKQSINIFSLIEKFYSYYPALYLVYWPPLNQVITAIFYTFFGVNNITSRLSVFLFSILSVIFIYKLIAEFYDKKSVKIILPIILTSPFFVFFSTVNFLEIPMIFFTVACTYYFFKTFVENSDNSVILGFLLGLSFLVKWNMGILYMTFFLFLLFRKKKELFGKKFLKTSIIFFLFAVPFLTLMFFTGGINAVIANVGSGFWLSISDLYFYLISPFLIFFPIFTTIGFYGLLLVYKKRNKPQYFFILLYFIVSYLIFTFLFQMKLHRFLTTFYLPFFSISIYLGLEKINSKLKNNLIISITFISIIFLQIVYWFYITPAGSEILDFSRNHEEVASFVTKDLKENSNILLLDDKPSHIYHICQKIPLFSHHIDRLRHCEEVTNFSSYIEENNIAYIVKEKDHPRHFSELETFDKTNLGNFEIYKTNLVVFPERKICNKYCKVDLEFCSV